MKTMPHPIASISILILVLAYSCTHKAEEKYQPPQDPLFTQLSSEETGVNFRNEVEDSSIYNILTYRNFYNGGGVAIGDINNDGLPDLFLTANLGESKLYLNKGNFKFEDITQHSGIKSKRGMTTMTVLKITPATTGWSARAAPSRPGPRRSTCAAATPAWPAGRAAA